jgi:hypothetical protein
MSTVVVVPVLHPAALRPCVETMHPELLERLLIIDNSQRGVGHRAPGRVYRPEHHGHPGGYRPAYNLGVARSMNVAADTGADVVVWVSTSVRFGPAGGRDLIAAAEASDLGMMAATCKLHAFAITRRGFDLAGRWDANLFPAYYEDTDWRRRLHLAWTQPSPGDPVPQHPDVERGMALPEVDVDVVQVRDGHGYDVLREANPGRVAINFEALQAYYARKWHGLPGAETTIYPFGDPSLPLDYWPPCTRKELIDRYGLGLA